MPESIPLPLLIVLIIAAVAVGLWVGGRADKELEARRDEGKGKTLSERARGAMTKGVVSLWKWNRSRKKKAKDRDKED